MRIQSSPALEVLIVKKAPLALDYRSKLLEISTVWQIWPGVWTCRMSTFVPLNLEPEDVSEEEVDDTKEIQLEEAFKLYQNALKLHSQGPAYYLEAAKAYDQLLGSDVFKYPETVSEFARDELETTTSDSPVVSGSTIASDPTSLSLVPTGSVDNSLNSLPHIAYLAYKNHGQFELDQARANLQERNGDSVDQFRQLLDSCKQALRDFTEALAQDDSDLDLWKKAARVAEAFSSQRLVRYCLAEWTQEGMSANYSYLYPV